jgi:hypothetical protein
MELFFSGRKAGDVDSSGTVRKENGRVSTRSWERLMQLEEFT